MKDPKTFLEELREQDVSLSLQDGQLRYDAPPGVVSKPLLDAIREHKAALVDYLTQQPAPQPDVNSGPQPRANELLRIPLSSEQRRMWFLTLLEGDSSYAYNMPPVVLELKGELSIEALETAFTNVVSRHEILRTSFANDDAGPCQVVRGAEPVRIESEVIDEKMIWSEIEKEASFPFSLTDERPLFRVRLFQTGMNAYVFCLTIHHIICDGWSIGILIRELSRSYSEATRGVTPTAPQLPIQYGDFSLWQVDWLSRSQAERSREFWRERLKARPDAPDLPADFVRSGLPDFRGTTRYRNLNLDLSDRIKKYCRQERLTEFMFLLGAYFVLLSRFTGSKDLVIGVPVSARPDSSLDELIGLFLNTIPLRINASEAPADLSIIEAVRQEFLAAFEHRELPLEEIIQAAGVKRDGSHSSIFNTLFALQNAPLDKVDLDGIQINPMRTVNVNSVLDLIMSIEEVDGAYELKLRGATQLFSPGALDQLLAQYETVVGELLKNPISCDKVQLCSTEDQVSIVPPREEFPIVDSIVERFDRVAQSQPGRPALTDGIQTLSYQELQNRVMALSHRVAPVVVEPGTPVAIYLVRGVDLIVAILAILKAGGSYVPLDTDSPSDRVAFILDDSGASAMLISDDGNEPPTVSRPISTINIAKPSSTASLSSVLPTAEDAAYTIYTSGSTGKPKGVAVSHANVLRLIDSTQDEFEFGPEDVWTMFHSPAFDFSVWEIFGPLLTGGLLAVVPWDVTRDPANFYRFVADNRITVLNQTPSAFARFDQQDESSEAALKIRLVIFGGEALDFRSLASWSERHGLEHPVLVNMYGITETTVHTTIRPIVSDDFLTPQKSRIGAPIADLGIALVDKDMRPVMRGAIGEIVVYGPGVAAGYRNRPELNTERFPDAREFPGLSEQGVSGRVYRSGDLARLTADDDLEYCGRADNQIKIHGYRIEPGEVEAAIDAHPAVRRSLISLFTDESGIPGLLAHLTWRPGAEADIGSVRSSILAKLPRYMCPSRFVVVDEFPLTMNGKIDRERLPSVEKSISETRLERTSSATGLAIRDSVMQAWKTVLSTDHILDHDDFFELGGDSVRAAMVVNMVQETLDQILYVAGLFEYPILEDYISYLEREYQDSRAEAPLTARASPIDFESFLGLIDQTAAVITSEGAKNPPAVFILSPPRSGSTLLRVLLGGHSQMFAPPELELLRFQTLDDRRVAFSGPTSFYLEGLIRALMELKDCSLAEAEQWIEEKTACGVTTKAMFFELQAMAKGKILVDKTPSYALEPNALQRIEQDFESPIYIHLYRHPCAMINSFRKAHLQEIFFRRDHNFPPEVLAELIWTQSHINILSLLENVPSERQVAVNFENLVCDTKVELQRICATIGIDCEEEMLNLYNDGRRKMTDGIRAESRMIGDVRFHQHENINTAVTDAWRGENQSLSLEHLSESARDIFRQLNDCPGSRDGKSVSDSEDVDVTWIPSSSQERIWFLDQLDDSSRAYTIPGAIRLKGRLDVDALENCVKLLVERHRVLRSRFVAIDGVLQIDVNDTPERLGLIDLSAEPDEKKQSRVKQLIDQNTHHEFDLAAGELFRLSLVIVGHEESVLLINLHHAVCDGWSIDILFRDLVALYNKEVDVDSSGLVPLTACFGDYALWQRQHSESAEVQGQLEYWRKQLSNLPSVLNLPTDFPRRPMQTFSGSRIKVLFNDRVSSEIKNFCRKNNCTVFMFLLANYAVMLATISGSTDIAIGTPVAARTRKSFEGLVGFFANTLVLRLNVGFPTFVEVLAAVRQVCINALSNQEIAFEQLVSELKPDRNLGISPLFQVMFSLQRKPDVSLDFLGVEAEIIEVASDTAKYDLSLLLEERTSSITGSFEFNSDLFSTKRIEFMADQFKNFVIGHLAESSLSCGPLDHIGKPEFEFIKKSAFGPRGQFSGELTLLDWVARGCSEFPETVAVSNGDNCLTYQELSSCVRLARQVLDENGVTFGDRVCVCLDRGLDLLPWLLAIMGSGACYVPIDSAFPDQRIKFILDDSKASLVVCSEHMRSRDCFRGKTAINARLDKKALMVGPMSNSMVPADSTAYICYTSGSTGRPKGVPVTHRAAVNLLIAMQRLLELDARDCWAAVTTISFDIHVPELFLALGVGGRIEVINDVESKDPSLLAAALHRCSATVLQATPSTWQTLKISGWQGDPNLLALSGGETLPNELAEFLKSRVRGVWNFYGPTETTVWSAGCCLTDIGQSSQPVSVGRPLMNTELFVLDESRNIVPVGVFGELAIGGLGLSDGYIDRSNLTQERFVELELFQSRQRVYLTGDRARLTVSGNFEVSGRLDNQMKIRGVRVEPEEIEAILRTDRNVLDAVVVKQSNREHDPFLVGALTLRNADSDEGVAQVAQHAEALLPNTMVPNKWVVLDEVPLTANGKTDRKRVAELVADLSQFESGQSDSNREISTQKQDLYEIRIRELWCEYLGTRNIGWNDNFFKLGGHSLLAVRLLAAIESEFGEKLPLTTFFEFPTIRLISERLRAGGDNPELWSGPVVLRKGSGQSKLLLVPGAGGNLIYFQELLQSVRGDVDVIGLQPPGLDGETSPFNSISGLADYFLDSLSPIFDNGTGEVVLAGHSFGGLVAAEMARQDRQSLMRLNALAIIDTAAPDLQQTVGLGWSQAQWIAHLSKIASYMFGKPVNVELSELDGVAEDVQITVFYRKLLDAAVIPNGTSVSFIAGLVNVYRANLSSTYPIQQMRIQEVPIYVLRSVSEQPDDVVDEVTRRNRAVEDLGWGQFLGYPVSLRRIPGDHLTMLQGANAKVVAESLNRCFH